jgi:hypothetical protein
VKEHEKDREKDVVQAYERPSVTDYGTLVDITRASNLANCDAPCGAGVSNAFPPSSGL